MPTPYRYLRGVAALLVAAVLGTLGTAVPAHADVAAPVPPGLRQVTIDEVRAMAARDPSAAAAQWYYLLNVNSGLVMAVSGGQDGNGVPIIQWTANGGQEQAWRLDRNEGGYLILRNGGTTAQKVVTIRDRSTANGAPAVQWTYAAQDNQEFLLGDYGNGTYEFMNRRSGKCLAVPGASRDKGIGIIQWPCNGKYEQRWALYYWS